MLVGALLPGWAIAQSCAPTSVATALSGGSIRSQLLAFDVVNTHPTLPVRITGLSLGMNSTSNVTVLSRVRSFALAPLQPHRIGDALGPG